MAGAFDLYTFANQVNAYLAAIPQGQLVDVKYSTLYVQSSNQEFYTAMVISYGIYGEEMDDIVI